MTEYTNIRQILGSFIGKRLVEITQHDQEEFDETGVAYVQLHFEDGNHITFPVMEEPFSYSEDDDGNSDGSSEDGQ